MEMFFVLLVIVVLLYWLYSRYGWYVNIPSLATHVAERLYLRFLRPIENEVYGGEANYKTEIVYDKTLIRHVIRYVEEAHRLLNAFYDASWRQESKEEKQPSAMTRKKAATDRQKTRAFRLLEKAWKKKQNNAEYFLWDIMVQRFIYEKKTSITGQDLYDPFAFWVQELYFCVHYKALSLSHIQEVHICEHGTIAFKTSRNLYNMQRGKFTCGECTAPREVFEMTET